MYRVYKLTAKEKNKIVQMRWDGDSYYYDVFDNKEEFDKEQERIKKIEEEYKEKQEEYLKSNID